MERIADKRGEKERGGGGGGGEGAKKSRYAPRRCDAEKTLELPPLSLSCFVDDSVDDRPLRGTQKSRRKTPPRSRRLSARDYARGRARVIACTRGKKRLGEHFSRVSREARRRDRKKRGVDKEKDDSLLAPGRRYTREKVRDLFRAFLPPARPPAFPLIFASAERYRYARARHGLLLFICQIHWSDGLRKEPPV